MFKVGDLVIGNENNQYCITDKHTVCCVISINKLIMRVQVQEHLTSIQPTRVGTIWEVRPNEFKLYKKRMSHLPEWW